MNIKFRAIDKSTNNIIYNKRSLTSIIRDELLGRNKTYLIQIYIGNKDNNNEKIFEDVEYERN